MKRINIYEFEKEEEMYCPKEKISNKHKVKKLKYKTREEANRKPKRRNMDYDYEDY